MGLANETMLITPSLPKAETVPPLTGMGRSVEQAPEASG